MPPENTYYVSSILTRERVTLEKAIQLDSPPPSTIELAHCIVHVWMFFGQEGVTSALASYATQVVRREKARPFFFYDITFPKLIHLSFNGIASSADVVSGIGSAP